MTNKEVIKELELMRKFNYTLAPMEVFDIAIKALETLDLYATNELLKEGE